MWSRKYKVCRSCGKSGFPHKGKGLCTSCYYRQYRKSTGRYEGFVGALPLLLRQLGLFGITVSLKGGQVTIKHKNMTATWPES
jgi:hypothetical protein